jgi:membrane-associated phospholipid phosphatase
VTGSGRPGPDHAPVRSGVPGSGVPGSGMPGSGVPGSGVPGSGGRRWGAPAATAVGLAAALVVLTVVELTSPPAAADAAVLDWLLAHRTDRLTAVARTVTNTGASPLLFPLLAVTGLLVARRTGRWRPGIAALCVAALGVLSRLVLSIAVGDERPAVAERLVPVTGFAFPSGHAATSALVAGAAVWLLGQVIAARWARLAVGTVLLAWALAVALSRPRRPLGQ